MEGWIKRLRLPCAGLGGLCLLATVWAAHRLERGGWLDHAGVAAALIVLAAMALFLLRFEGYGRDVLLAMLLPVGAAMLVRALCLDYAGVDYTGFLAKWCDFFRQNGGFSAMARSVGDYNVPYLYFLALFSYIPVPDLYMIKLLSIAFDVVLAWGCLRLVRSLVREQQGSYAPLIAFAVALLLPTVVLNGAYWAQCDVIYGALAVHAVTLVLEGKNKTSVALMALAFSFKLQTVFLLPLWGVLWLAKKVKFRELWVFPLAYVVIVLPAILMGKPVLDTFGVYLNQMGEYTRLALNAPSIFQLLPYHMTIVGSTGDPLLETLGQMGTAAAGLFVLAVLAVGFRFRERLTEDILLTMAVVLTIGVPFLLPHMHERYFFLADVLTLCWACVNVRRLPVAALVQASSAASYRVWLRFKFNFEFYIGENRYVMIPEMLAMLAALAVSVTVLVRQLRDAGGPAGQVNGLEELP